MQLKILQTDCIHMLIVYLHRQIRLNHDQTNSKDQENTIPNVKSDIKAPYTNIYQEKLEWRPSQLVMGTNKSALVTNQLAYQYLSVPQVI